MSETTRICIAGATGWTGRAIADGVLDAPDLELVASVSRSAAGSELGGAPVHGTVAEALAEGVEVLIDYRHEAAKEHALTALGRGVPVVIGTSGLTADDYAEIDVAARDAGVGAVASGNFSLTAAMASAGALLAARHLPAWEVIDYAKATKPDVPSGTARELAERLSAVAPSPLGRPLDEIAGPVEARGATVGAGQVHSVRLPGFVVSTEVVFGLPDERLTIRHDAGGAAALRGGHAARRAGGARAGRADPRTRRAAARRLKGYPSAMPRSLWNGTITFGVIAVPVKLYTATESKTVRFREVHLDDEGKIEHRRFCSKEEKEVPYDEVVKGHEVREGEFVVLEKEEIEAAAGDRAKIIELEAFVEAAAIDPVYYQKTYYVGAGDAGTDAYRLLHDALGATERAGLGRFTFHNREYLAAVRPLDGILGLHTMRFADELVPGKDIDFDAPSRKPAEKEVEMARKLVDSLHESYDPGHRTDATARRCSTDRGQGDGQGAAQGRRRSRPRSPTT